MKGNRRKIKHEPPALYWLVRLFFPDYEFFETTAFSFGDTIYTKENPLAEYHIIHEEVHLRQMRHSKIWGVIQFLRYRFSRKFRYQCELEAYRTEYRWLKENSGEHRLFLKKIAEALSDKEMYGGLVSYERAIIDLTS